MDYDDDLRARSGPRRHIDYDDYGDTSYDPRCPWCGEDIAGWHRAETIITCPDCAKESYLRAKGIPEIIGLMAEADIKYIAWLKDQGRSLSS